ncbi:hypothetical protein D3C80_2193470 [compost metagenome]
MHGVAHPVLQRLAKAKPVDGARAVFVDLCRCRFPAGEATFAETLDDLTQPSQDRITLEIAGAAALV